MDTFYKKLRNHPGCALHKLVDGMLGKQLEASEGAQGIQFRHDQYLLDWPSR